MFDSNFAINASYLEPHINTYQGGSPEYNRQKYQSAIITFQVPILAKIVEFETLCLLSDSSSRPFLEFSWRGLSLEEIIDLGISNVLGLGDFDPGKNEPNDTEAKEDEANLAPQVTLISIEHVRNTKSKSPGHEGVDEETDTKGLGSKDG